MHLVVAGVGLSVLLLLHGKIPFAGSLLLAALTILAAAPHQSLRLFHSSGGRLVIGTALMGWLLSLGYSEPPTQPTPILLPALAVAALATYVVFILLTEKRVPVEVLSRRAPAHLALGILLGAVLSSPQLLAGTGRLLSPEAALFALSAALFAGVVEELLFRAVLLRLSEQLVGSLLALLLSSTLFALLHGQGLKLNTFAAGMALGALYLHTRQVWLPIGGHFAHNALFDLISGGHSADLERVSPLRDWAAGLHAAGLIATALTAMILARQQGRLLGLRQIRSNGAQSPNPSLQRTPPG